MKLPFPRYMIARSSHGVVLEDGDAVVQVPAVVLPSAIVGTPLDLTNLAGVTSILNGSFFNSQSILQVGAQIAKTQNFPIFGKGMWHITSIMQYAFTGTANSAAPDGLVLTSLNGITDLVAIWQTVRTGTNNHVDLVFEHWLCIPDDGARFILKLAASVALDVVMLSVSINASKLW
mgnify:CR=1 FL=1